MDITTMKLKKDLGIKNLNKIKLKEPKIPKILPQNKGINNIYNITKGKSNKKGIMNVLPQRKQNNFMNMLNLPKNKTFRMPRINDGFKLGNMGNIGQVRIRQQKGLKPWGDFDGDKLPNVLDCNPRNRFKQGPTHTIEDKLNPSDDLRENYETSENIEITEMPQEEEQFSQDEFNKSVGSDEVSKQQKILDMLETSKRRKELQILELKNKEKQLEIARREKKLKEEKKTTAQKGLTQVEKLGKTVGGGISTISKASTGFGGFGVSQNKLVGATGLNASQYNILVALGKAPPIQRQAMPVPQQAPQSQDTFQQAQQNPNIGVVSPYSKRRVTYVRGPYNKNR